MSKSKNQNQTQATAEEKKKAVAVVRKLSVATVYGKIKVADIPKGEELKLCRIAGVAGGTDSGESAYGDWKCLTGEFAATNYATGEIFAGAKAFVPGAMGEMFIQQMENALLNDAGARMKFCVDIFAVVSPRDENKYEYVVRPIMETNVQNEALSLLEMN